MAFAFASSISYVIASDFDYKDPMNILLFAIYGTMLMPFVLALHSPKSFFAMLICFIPYYLFLPTLVAYFGAYSFARLDDLSWGNRQSVGDQTEEEEIRDTAQIVCIFIVLSNLLLLIAFIEVAGCANTNDTVCDTIQTTFLYVLATLVFSYAILQIILSALYFMLGYMPRRGFELLVKGVEIIEDLVQKYEDNRLSKAKIEVPPTEANEGQALIPWSLWWSLGCSDTTAMNKKVFQIAMLIFYYIYDIFWRFPWEYITSPV